MALKAGSYNKSFTKVITVTSRQVFFSTQEFTVGGRVVMGDLIHVEYNEYPLDSDEYVWPMKEWVSDTGKITIAFYNQHSAAVTPGEITIKVIVL